MLIKAFGPLIVGNIDRAHTYMHTQGMSSTDHLIAHAHRWHCTHVNMEVQENVITLHKTIHPYNILYIVTRTQRPRNAI